MDPVMVCMLYWPRRAQISFQTTLCLPFVSFHRLTSASQPAAAQLPCLIDAAASTNKAAALSGEENSTISSFIYFSPPSSPCPHPCDTCQHPVGLQQMWHHYSSSSICNPPYTHTHTHTRSLSLSPQHHRLPRIPSFSLLLHTQPFWFSKQHMRDTLR